MLKNDYEITKTMPKALGLFFFRAKLHQPSLEELVDIAIHNTLHIRGLIVGAVIFHAAVVEDIGADLATPFDFHLARLNLVLLLHAVAHLTVVEL